MKRTFFWTVSLLFFIGLRVRAQWSAPDASNNIHNINTGNVGIYTSNPTERLQLGDQFFFQDGGWKGVLRNMTWSSSQNTNVRAVNGPAAGMFLTDDGQIIFQVSPSGTAGASVLPGLSQLNINNAGQLCIGTSNSNGYSLAVNGPAIFTKAVVKLYSNWPDYIFSPAYHLLSLDSVYRYIQTNHHLPDLPSADSIARTGIDLGENQAALLKKIEELTLYMIEMNKENAQLLKRVKKLEQAANH